VNRRTFLGAVATAALGPAWLRRAFADDACDTAGLGTLSNAFRRAARSARPLLVLVIPVDDQEKWSRGHAWGELLNHGSDAELAPLAGCELVCARMADVVRLFPGVLGEPLAIVATTERVPAGVRALDAELPEWAGWMPSMDGDDRAAEDASISARIEALAQMVREGVGEPHGDVAALASRVREMVRERPVPGSHWGLDGGCGTTVEGRDDLSEGLACGMGHVPARSRRFLHWLTRRQL